MAGIVPGVDHKRLSGAGDASLRLAFSDPAEKITSVILWTLKPIICKGNHLYFNMKLANAFFFFP